MHLPVKYVFAAASLFAVTAATFAADAAHKGINMDPAKSTARSPATEAVVDVRTANALARYGDAHKDALALIVAAQMKKRAGERQGNPKLISKEPANEDSKHGPDMTADALLERARSLASGRKDLLALADDAAASGSRGASDGPQVSHMVAHAHGIIRYEIEFTGGEPAAVVMSGDGDSQLDLYVYDENGNVLCRRDGAGDDAMCLWTPRWTSTFTIRVVNRGAANEYQLATN